MHVHVCDVHVCDLSVEKYVSSDKMLMGKYILLKSLSPIHFVKIWLSNFLCNEFLVKMYKL